MLILSIHHGAHDMTAAVADDYHMPTEALRALQDGRIDFIAAESGVYRAAKKE